MKIANFRLIEVTGRSATDWKYRATVDVTTGLFKKKTKTVEVFKNYAGSWFFLDSGKFVLGPDVDEMARSFAGRCGKELEKCLNT